MLLKTGGKSSSAHSNRLYEVECAKEYGIPFNENWYMLDTYTRAMMMAGTIVRNILTNMEIKQSQQRR